MPEVRNIETVCGLIVTADLKHVLIRILEADGRKIYTGLGGTVTNGQQPGDELSRLCLALAGIPIENWVQVCTVMAVAENITATVSIFKAKVTSLEQLPFRPSKGVNLAIYPVAELPCDQQFFAPHFQWILPLICSPYPLHPFQVLEVTSEV